jgi:hypothetical protein
MLLVLALVLAACGGQAARLPAPGQPVANLQPSSPAAEQPLANQQPALPAEHQQAAKQPEPSLTRTDEGGAVTFEVTPLNLDSGSATLDFEVDMNTHSVDLGFDLATMAVLKTDTGAEIAPSAYQGGSGHHVRGRLSFAEAPVDGAKTLTLVIRDAAGVAERTFTWQRQ